MLVTAAVNFLFILKYFGRSKFKPCDMLSRTLYDVKAARLFRVEETLSLNSVKNLHFRIKFPVHLVGQ